MNKLNDKGERHGYWEEYWSNGNLDFKGNYTLNGKKDGYWESCYVNGNLFSRGNYINDERDGLWEWGDFKDNEIITKAFYL